jgi:hypothetical protein
MIYAALNPNWRLTRQEYWDAALREYPQEVGSVHHVRWKCCFDSLMAVTIGNEEAASIDCEHVRATQTIHDSMENSRPANRLRIIITDALDYLRNVRQVCCNCEKEE